MPSLPDKEVSRRKMARSRARPRAVSRQKIERQERCLVLTAQGVPRREIEAEIGVGTKAIDQWNFHDKEFKARYQHARAKARGDYVPQEVAFDAAFRDKYFHHATPPHLERLIEVINEQVRLAKKEKSRDRRVLILLPPEHAKSTLLEEYVTYRVATDPAFRCSVVCATQGQARKRLGSIARRLTDRSAFSELVDTFGPFKSELRADNKPWTADYFLHVLAPPDQRDYTVQALGWTGSIYGDRQELILCDDIADLKNQTPAEIAKQWEKLWGEFRSRLVKGGLFVVIGTHMRENDIYTVMEEKGFFTDKVVMAAIEREPGTLGDEDPGKALWEDHVSMRELLKLKETDPRMFELMYQQNPLPSIGAVFTQESIESCFDDDRYIGHIPDKSIIVAGVDPSVRNYTAGVVFAVAPSGMRYLVDVRNEKGLTGEGGDRQAGVVEFIVKLCKDYGVSTLCVEDGTWMELINSSFTLKKHLFELGVRHHGNKIGPASGEREEHVIAQLSGLFNHGLISLPGSPSARAYLQTMIHQFLTWTPDKQHWRKAFDIVKAFRQAEYAARFLAQPGKPHVPMSGGSDVPAFLEKVGVA